MNDIGKWTRFSTGSTFESINSADIKDARIGYPKLNEQNLIGNILEKMDSIIAANEYNLKNVLSIRGRFNLPLLM
ncbi:Type I restriction-modification system specificity subunit S [Lactiplantibacillus plantarum]|nr:Type I restriction-modification system specificity subunit S [Lactiplantibacillus plantarum]